MLRHNKSLIASTYAGLPLKEGIKKKKTVITRLEPRRPTIISYPKHANGIIANYNMQKKTSDQNPSLSESFEILATI